MKGNGVSWDSDPYRNMEITWPDQNGSMCRWHCHNCGGDARNWWHVDEPIRTLRNDWLRHVCNSHNTKASDTRAWSH